MAANPVDTVGPIGWIGATGMGLMEWLGGIEFNKWLTTGSLILGIVYIVYRIRTQRIELKLKQRELDGDK